MTKPAFKVTPPPGGKVALMMDSGVFSAWNKGGSIDLKEYIAYLKRYEKLLYSYVVVDHIPGKFGVKRAPEEVEQSASISYKNLQRMKDAGLDPIPVFHQGEDPKWLMRMIEDGDRYIGISTAKDLPTREQRKWLDRMFTLITNPAGQPLIRTHGFGITNPSFLFRYPWFTVDSTTWSLHAGMGHILFPQYEGVQRDKDGNYFGGQPNFLRKPMSLITSGVIQTSSPTAQERQFEKFVYEQSKLKEYCIQRFLKDHLDVTIDQIRNSSQSRRRSILVYYMRLCEQLRDVWFTHRSDNLLTSHIKPAHIKNPCKPGWNLHLMFATKLIKSWSSIMTDLGAETRLLSYYEMREQKDGVLERYIMTGTNSAGPYVPRVPKQQWDRQTYLTYRSLKLEQRLTRIAGMTNETN